MIRRTAALLAAVALLVSGCGAKDNGGVAGQAGSQQGYVSGSGVVSQIAADQRSAPINLDFTQLDGKRTSLAEYRRGGKVTVINLWYAACPPCRKEAPDLASTAKKYKDRAQFLGVNVRDREAAAEGFVKTFKIDYPTLLDTEGQMVGLLSDVLPPRATPSTVVLDGQGRPAARVVGAVDASTLRGLIDDVLAEK